MAAYSQEEFQRLLSEVEKNPDKYVELRDKLWYEGALDYLLRPHAQTDVYWFTHRWKESHPKELGPLVWNCHRGMGKSYLLVLICIERCLRYPHQQVKFGAPTGKQAAEIIEPLINLILEDCPQELYPRKCRNRYTFKNPKWGSTRAESVFQVVSCKDDADDQRGLRSDLVVLDEVRDIDNTTYVINDIFNFHFAQRKNPLMILSSTPPKATSHPFWTIYADEADREGRYINVSIDKNEDFSDEDERILLNLCNKDRTSSTWRREALCERVPDVASLLIPEFSNLEIQKATIVDSYERPKYYFATESVDFGWCDNQAVIFGYVDFEKQLLVIDDEIVVHYKTIGELARLIKEKEKLLFFEAPYPIRRFGDNDLLELQNLSRDHGLHISAADKWNAEAAIASLRTKFSEGKIRINSKCKRLIDQLKNGMKDEKGRIVRSEDPSIGHCDAIMALVYMNRMIGWSRNPVPWKPKVGYDIWPANQIAPQSSIPITRTNIPVINRGRLC